MTPLLEIRLFGGLRISLDHAAVPAFMSAKVPALLAYLAVTGRPQRRDDLAALLWGELPDADARNNLRQALANLRRSLDAHLLITRDDVALNPAAPCTLDVSAFEQALRSEHDLAPELHAARLGDAMALYAGDFLAGFFVRDAPAFEEWMLSQRARYRELALHALHTLTQLHLDRGHYDRAIDAATRLLALDEWREEAHCQLMLALARTGQRSAALAQYQRCRRLLSEEFGVEPAAATTALYNRVKAALAEPRHNLPAALTGFVGREQEIATLRHLLAGRETRLLTIQGPGGAGKTRLAVEVARACEPGFLNGVWFVAPAGMSPGGAGALVQAVADALGWPLAGRDDPGAQLLAHLSARELLLVLDSPEEWLDGVDWLCELLAQAPDVTVLATARQRLDLQAERVFMLEGLPIPPSDHAATGAYAAVELFVRRARRVQADFALTPAEHAAVIRICRAVQGLPLGIELAAAWVHQLTAAEIAAEIERSLDFLTTNRRDVAPRQRSLRAVFDWSWGRLAPDEQALFARLAVFHGPFSREAAESVAGASPRLLSALADKSLLWRRGTTYQLHEVARRYAQEQLARTGAAGEIEIAHARYYVKFLAHREASLKGRGQQAALADIEAEIGDVRAAWRRLTEQRDETALGAATGGLYHFHLLRSRFREGLDAFRAARLALAETRAADPATRLVHARLLAREARFCSSLARYEEAQGLLSASREALTALDAPSELAFVLGHIGGIARLQGELDTAAEHLWACLALRRQLGDGWGQAIALLELAGVAFMRGDYETAQQRCEGRGWLQATATATAWNKHC